MDNVWVRRQTKAEVRKHLHIDFQGVSRQGVSVVKASARVGGVTYSALATAKWHKPDVFDPEDGIRRATERAIVEIVDRILDPERRTLSQIME